MKTLLSLALALLLLYVLVCGVLYFRQEKLLFFPRPLPPGYRFSFQEPFEEKWLPMADGIRLHGLLFQAPQAKGLIFYLHGNGGALDSWGEVAATYTALGYDVFLLDYRGYGKSQGHIGSEAQLLQDVQTAYRLLLPHYPEGRTVVLGYSLGTGPAAWLAARQHPRLLLLQAPYYSLADIAHRLYPFLPGFLLRYPLRTHTFLGRVQCPVVLFHGQQDEVIYYESSVKLQKLLGPRGRLIPLPDAGHNGMSENPLYQHKLREVL